MLRRNRTDSRPNRSAHFMEGGLMKIKRYRSRSPSRARWRRHRFSRRASWTITPHGRLDFRVAAYLKLTGAAEKSVRELDMPFEESRRRLAEKAASVSGPPIEMASVKDTKATARGLSVPCGYTRPKGPARTRWCCSIMAAAGCRARRHPRLALPRDSGSEPRHSGVGGLPPRAGTSLPRAVDDAYRPSCG